MCWSYFAFHVRKGVDCLRSLDKDIARQISFLSTLATNVCYGVFMKLSIYIFLCCSQANDCSK